MANPARTTVANIHAADAITIESVATELNALSSWDQLYITRRGGPLQTASQRQEGFLQMAASPGERLNDRRQICAAEAAPQLQARVNELRGANSFPPVDRFCRAAIEGAVRAREASWHYMDRSVRERDQGDRFEPARHAEGMGRTPIESVRAIRVAAEAGQATYTGLQGQTLPVSCPLAVDVGATWGQANVALVTQNRPALTPQEINAAARACYTPGTTTIAIRGETMPAQRAGLIIGELLGRDVQLAPTATPAAAPLAPPAPTPQQRRRTSQTDEAPLRAGAVR